MDYTEAFETKWIRYTFNIMLAILIVIAFYFLDQGNDQLGLILILIIMMKTFRQIVKGVKDKKKYSLIFEVLFFAFCLVFLIWAVIIDL
ncbi:DUF6442 family protein [Halalkalibacillus halophilus]|uniref:DUF6442 family protein n=1 Tax=Halalkalibacillus halophilus TaxID=392827 RepID=UPI0003FE2C64|nr:DUF6442 family protein [Halalkalibacillus halophilus]